MGNENEEGGYKPSPGQEYNWPGSADEEQQRPLGAAAAVADVVEMTDWIPLVGTAGNLIKAGIDGGSAIYHGSQAKDAYNSGDAGTGGKKIDEAEEDAHAMTGDFINALPLVGTARALM